MRRTILPLLQYVFTAWCLVYLLFTFYASAHATYIMKECFVTEHTNKWTKIVSKIKCDFNWMMKAFTLQDSLSVHTNYVQHDHITEIFGAVITNFNGWHTVSPFAGKDDIWLVTMKFPERFYCRPHTRILTAYWEGSPSKCSPWAAMRWDQRCCHCWKQFWNSCCTKAFSAVLTFFDAFKIPKSSSL
jgi:hypothetical protein